MSVLFSGCRSAAVNLEGRSVTGWSTGRHCVVARLQDVTIERFLEIRSKAGALLVVLPPDLNALSPLEKEVCTLHFKFMDFVTF